jgi:hypothetical protein
VAVARVVDQNVDATEAGEGCVDGGPDGVGTGDVEGDGQQAVAIWTEGLDEGFTATGGGDDAVAGVEGGADDGGAEAARGPGDEPGFRGGGGHGKAPLIGTVVMLRQGRRAVDRSRQTLA